jgi:prepilin signal peptidase PulO-like enzyme (type II secretory pathway)
MLKHAADFLTVFTAAFKNMWAIYLLPFHTCRRARDYIKLPISYWYFAAENILLVTFAYLTFLHFYWSNLNKLTIMNTVHISRT